MKSASRKVLIALQIRKPSPTLCLKICSLCLCNLRCSLNFINFQTVWNQHRRFVGNSRVWSCQASCKASSNDIKTRVTSSTLLYLNFFITSAMFHPISSSFGVVVMANFISASKRTNVMKNIGLCN